MKAQGEIHNLLEKNNEEEDENDMIEIQLQSTAIKVNFVNLFTYSKYIRDEYKTLKEAKLKLSDRFQIFQKNFSISDDNSILFFKSFKNEDFLISNQNYGDLYKLSNFFKVKRLTKILKQYKDNHNFDPDFIINEILKQISNKATSNYANDNFNINMESTLCSKVNECLQTERFGLLPISIVYRILSKSEEEISSDLLFDFISKSIENRCTLFHFLNVDTLSDSKFGELIDLYDQYNNQKSYYFQCLPTANLKLMKQIKDENKILNEKCNKLQGLLDDVFKFINGCLIDKDLLGPESFTYAKSRSEKGNEMAKWLLGFYSTDDNDDETELLSYYQKSIDDKNPYALYLLGFIYEEGNGVEQDYRKAFQYYKKSAENGNPYAMFKLGNLYEERKLDEEEEEEEVKESKKSKENVKKSKKSKEEKEEEKEVEIEEEVKESKKSKENVKKSKEEKEVEIKEEEEDKDEENNSIIIKYYNQAASHGITTALISLGDLYMEDICVEQDYSKAIDYYTQASDLGNYEAFNKLGEMYKDGVGVEIDLSKALDYYEKSNKIRDDYTSRSAIKQIKDQLSSNNKEKKQSKYTNKSNDESPQKHDKKKYNKKK